MSAPMIADGATGFPLLRMRRPDAFRLSAECARVAREYPDASPEDCRYQACANLQRAADRLDRAAWNARHFARTFKASDPRCERMYRAAVLVGAWAAATRREAVKP